ncbi:MAG TPA: lysophospholipase [Symbiobacteriaceae bacterium]
MRRTEGFITTPDGLRLFCRTWEPERPAGSMVIVHGTNEHMGRYGHVVDYFLQHGLAVYGLDQRGFGRSEGIRCYVDRFEDYLTDLRCFLEQCGICRPVLVGHSLGGLIAYRYAVAYPETLSAVVLSSPFFGLRWGGGPLLRAAAHVLGRLAPQLQIPNPVPAWVLSRDPAVVRAYQCDPLVGRTVTPRWFVECLRAGRDCRTGRGGELQAPALFLQAGDDLLVSPAAARQVYERVPHARKAFRLYPGKYHEIFNDPGYKKVFQDIWEWLNKEVLVHIK